MAGKLEAAASGEERTEHGEASDQGLLSATLEVQNKTCPQLWYDSILF
jgi:hypothetical protein